MTETTASLRRVIHSARNLHSVVRAMKAMASANITHCEQAVRALADYATTVRLGLGVAAREAGMTRTPPPRQSASNANSEVIVFGSDQGLVGQFNERVAGLAAQVLATLTPPFVVRVVGERVATSLQETGSTPAECFASPNTIEAVAPLVGLLLTRGAAWTGQLHEREVHLVYNRHVSGAQYAPHHERLLPLNEAWFQEVAAQPWPTQVLPETAGDTARTLRGLVREHLFVSLFQACAESLSSENACRLSAMQRAEKNIGDMLTELTGRFHHLRQAAIDGELFDLVAGFETLLNQAPWQAAAPVGKRVAVT